MMKLKNPLRNKTSGNSPPMPLTAAVSMGIGAMVGAGIFALMGQAGAATGNSVYLSFFIAGIISLLSGYSYAKLGVRYPSSGGIVEYLAQSYGTTYITGVISILLYFSMVIVLAFLSNLVILILFILQALKDNPIVLYLLAALLFLAFSLEFYMQRIKNRTIKACISS